jgi:AcrR family transcriptional regulator
MKSIEKPRKNPTQHRAHATIDIVLEAAAQLLETVGEQGFNTNALAERAGVSVGTLYRYFPNKQAILAALGRRERDAYEAAHTAMRAGDTGGLALDRASIRTFLHAFGGRKVARRAAVRALITHADPQELSAGYAPVEAAMVDADGERLSPIQAFVLTRAIQGAMRAAVMEDVDFLHARELEDELVRLGRLYLGHSPPKRSA